MLIKWLLFNYWALVQVSSSTVAYYCTSQHPGEAGTRTRMWFKLLTHGQDSVRSESFTYWFFLCSFDTTGSVFGWVMKNEVGLRWRLSLKRRELDWQNESGPEAAHRQRQSWSDNMEPKHFTHSCGFKATTKLELWVKISYQSRAGYSLRCSEARPQSTATFRGRIYVSQSGMITFTSTASWQSSHLCLFWIFLVAICNIVYSVCLRLTGLCV